MSQPPLPAPLPPPPPSNVLPYAQAAPARPGVITAIAILSILLGSLSALTNLGGALQPISIMAMRSLPMPAGPTTAPVSPFANISLAPSIVSAVLSAIESGLGVYLLVAGILLMRNRASSRVHHIRYAAMKIPVTVLASFAAGWMQYDLQRSLFSAMPTPTTSPGMSVTFQALPAIVAVVTAGIGLLFALAYPVALLIALRRPTIRAYFSTLSD